MNESAIGRTGRTRAYRRHHMKRLKKKRIAWWGDVRNYHTPTMCSCFMCGNPRKHFNQLTIQERKYARESDSWWSGIEGKEST